MPIPKQVRHLSFNERSIFYDKWNGSVNQQVWQLNCGFKFGYPECCIYEFIQDTVMQSLIPELEYRGNPRVKYKAAYINSPPEQYWVPCYECIKNANK